MIGPESLLYTGLFAIWQIGNPEARKRVPLCVWCVSGVCLR